MAPVVAARNWSAFHEAVAFSVVGADARRRSAGAVTSKARREAGGLETLRAGGDRDRHGERQGEENDQSTSHGDPVE